MAPALTVTTFSTAPPVVIWIMSPAANPEPPEPVVPGPAVNMMPVVLESEGRPSKVSCRVFVYSTGGVADAGAPMPSQTSQGPWKMSAGLNALLTVVIGGHLFDVAFFQHSLDQCFV